VEDRCRNCCRLTAPAEVLTRFRSADDVYVPPATSRSPPPAGCVCFSVLDNGCGIAEEELGRVFRAFEQLQAGVAYKGACSTRGAEERMTWQSTR
jgi:signal transduction histidine kinase